MLPAAALLEDNDNASLYVVKGEPATTEIREVVIGMTDGEFVEILEGVQPNEQVIVLGSRLVENEQEVQVTKLTDELGPQTGQEDQTAVAALGSQEPNERTKNESTKKTASATQGAE